MKDKNFLMYLLAIIIVIGFFVFLSTMYFKEVPETNKEIFYMVAGALIGSFTAVVSYFFGSSKGSSDKNELLNKK